jgi:hypothetical protein
VHCVVGGVVSTSVTVWLHVAVLLHVSVNSHVRVMMCGQTPFVTVLKMVVVINGWQQVVVGVGWSKFQPVPHSTVLFEVQTTERFAAGAVTTNGTEHCAELLWLSVIVN